MLLLLHLHWIRHHVWGVCILIHHLGLHDSITLCCALVVRHTRHLVFEVLDYVLFVVHYRQVVHGSHEFRFRKAVVSVDVTDIFDEFQMDLLVVNFSRHVLGNHFFQLVQANCESCTDARALSKDFVESICKVSTSKL